MRVYPVHFDDDCLCVAMNRKGACEKCTIPCNKVVKVDELVEWAEQHLRLECEWMLKLELLRQQRVTKYRRKGVHFSKLKKTPSATEHPDYSRQYPPQQKKPGKTYIGTDGVTYIDEEV